MIADNLKPSVHCIIIIIINEKINVAFSRRTVLCNMLKETGCSVF